VFLILKTTYSYVLKKEPRKKRREEGTKERKLRLREDKSLLQANGIEIIHTEV
jgi:hypothetical protein